MTEIFVDADACPVKDEVVRVASRHKVKVHVVSNGGIRPHPDPMVETVIVPEGPDVADKWIADRIGPGDICVTGDIPLAARCVAAGGLAIKHDGHVWDEKNVGGALATRDLMADIRAANPLGMAGGGKSFTKADRSRFLGALETLVRRAKAVTPSK